MAEASDMRLGCWTATEILDRKSLEFCESESCSAYGGDCGFKKVKGKTPVSDSDAKEGVATLAG